jgi:hypothetical protein
MMEVKRTLCDQCGKVIKEVKVKTDKEKYLEFWTPTLGETEALDSWKRKLEMMRLPPKTTQIISDIKPYISQIDGSVISSRSQHRDHLRSNGCVEVGNESMSSNKTTWIEQKSQKEALRQEIAARLDSYS